MKLTIRFSTCLLLVELLTACTFAGKREIVPSSLPATASASSATLDRTAIASCPVTLPNGKSPTLQSSSGFNLGNEDGTLFTSPWPNGIVVFTADGSGHVSSDGSLEMKWYWWRGVKGALTVQGRRLDASAPTLRTDINDGYGDSGLLPMGLIFPTQGCWEVTGTVGNARLTFVTLVMKVPFRLIFLNWGPKGLVSTTYDTSKLPEILSEIMSYSNGGELIMESAVDEQALLTPDPNATQQKLTVQSQAGICVQGALVNGQWQDNADAGFLQWTADSTSYRISHQGLGLQCNDLLSMLNTP